MRMMRIALSTMMALLLIASSTMASTDAQVWQQRAHKEAVTEGYKLISAADVAALIKGDGDFVILDVRPDYEYDRGHIPSAKNLEFHLGDRLGLKPEKATALAKIVGPDKSRDLIIYCRSFKCLRSGIAAKWAVQQGYKRVHRFVTGWHGWLKYTGKPLSQGPAGPGVGDYFPSCRLVVLGGDSDRQYLGLPAKSKAFDLGEVDADFLFVEFYHQLCYGCLREVASYNELFQKINSDRFLNKRLKMLGLGVGSLLREVRKFQRKEGVLFPLFADQNKEVFRCLGEPALPTAYVLGRNANGRLKILRILPGHIGDTEKVLGEIKAAVATAAP
jgi:rhodanese-related sulfurtransferase/peroxiredoxin